MAFTNLRYGFYNYNAGDVDPKVYDSEDMSKIFDGIITDGVYQNYKNGLWVKASEVANQVIISSGRAWFDHTWSYVDADTIFDLTSYPISEPYTRIDAIVLDVDTINRTNEIKVIQGTEVTASPVKPTLINTTGHVQHGLAFITRIGGQNVITQDRIEDVRGQAAYNSAWVTGLLSQMTIDQIVAQWETEFDTWNEAQRESFLLWRAAREEEFIAWFNEMKDQLSEDAAGRLQQEIDSISLAWDGTASATTVRKQLLMKNNVAVGEVSGSAYMEQTVTIPAGGTTTVTFSNNAISTNSCILVFTSIDGYDYDSMQISAGTCSIVYTNTSTSASASLIVTIKLS